MNFSQSELVSLLKREDFTPVYRQADELRRRAVGEEIRIRALLEFSNHCKRSCRYCGLNCRNTSLPRFRMTPDEIVDTAVQAAEAGYQTIVLQSGEDPWYTAECIGEIVRRIKRDHPIAVTLSCGEFPAGVYAYWKECGADRYLLKHETSDPALYASLHPDSNLEERVRCLRDIKAAGLETGGGFMIGLPGQTLETVAGDLLLLQELSCDMAGIGPFIPSPGTPLAGEKAGSTELTCRAVALARLLLPNANLPATTALGVLDREDKQNVFSCGANVVMQKVTPPALKKLYQIYPAQFADQDIRAGREAMEEEIRRLGRVPV